MTDVISSINIDEIFLAVIVVAVFLIVLTILLVLTVKRVNVITRKNFIDKLQEYDGLVDEREAQIDELNKIIEQRQADNQALEEKAKELAKTGGARRGSGAIVFPKYANLVSGNILGQYKLIKNNFNFDVSKKVEEFIKKHPEDKEKTRLYKVYYKVRSDLGFDALFKLSTYQRDEQQRIIKELFANEMDDLLSLIDKPNFDVVEMARELDGLIMMNDPKFYVLTPNEGENYNHINKDVVTKYDPSITEGFKITYQGSISDFSI